MTRATDWRLVTTALERWNEQRAKTASRIIQEVMQSITMFMHGI